MAPGRAFHPTKLVLAAFGSDQRTVNFWSLNEEALIVESSPAATPQAGGEPSSAAQADQTLPQARPSRTPALPPPPLGPSEWDRLPELAFRLVIGSRASAELLEHFEPGALREALGRLGHEATGAEPLKTAVKSLAGRSRT